MRKNLKSQEGSVLLESLIAVVIFSLGLLGLVATLTRATASVNDTRGRDEVFMAAQSAMDRTRLNTNKTNAVSVKNYLQNEQQFAFDRNGEVAKNSKNKEGECIGTTVKDSKHLGQNKNHISTTEIVYGMVKTDGNAKSRVLTFCSYRDDGPYRE